MLALLTPLFFAVFLWWFATGAVFWVGSRAEKSRKFHMITASGLAISAFAVLMILRDVETISSAYLAFSAAIVIWGWHELSFLYGFITGPRTTPCPPKASGYARFSAAFETVLFHELAILITAIAIAFIGIGAENMMGTMTFFILWMMRISAKLNLFFGAPNVADDMMPDHLAYMKTYFRKGHSSVFFAVSVTLGTTGVCYLGARAMTATDAVGQTQAVLLASLLGLAVLEHWFFVLPFKESRLWAFFNERIKPTEKLVIDQGQENSKAAKVATL